MSDRQVMIIASPSHRVRAVNMVQNAPDGYIVEVKPKTRSLEQNRMLWACLDDVAKQVVWHGYKLSRNEWKDFFTATLKGCKIVPNMESSGFIAVGGKTSDMNKREFCDLINLIYAFGAEHCVRWSDDASEVYAKWLDEEIFKK